jgi:hypothetical protein
MDTLRAHLKRIAPLGGRARWQGKTQKERSDFGKFMNSKKRDKIRGGKI